MTLDAWDTRHRRSLTATILLLVSLVVPLMPDAHARTAMRPEPTTEAVWEEGSGEPGDEPARWWGVVGAALCGGEIRLILRAPAIGMNPYVLAAGIAGCGLAALDILTTQ